MFWSLLFFVGLSAFLLFAWLHAVDRRKPGRLPTVTWVQRERVSAVPAKWRRDQW